MNIDILLGLQWGDEGKGKIVDAISPDYDIIARFQGGPNAGHSLEFNNVKHVLHLIPSGIFHPDKLNIIGNGVVIDPAVFKKEIEELGASCRVSWQNDLLSPIRQILFCPATGYLMLPMNCTKVIPKSDQHLKVLVLHILIKQAGTD